MKSALIAYSTSQPTECSLANMKCEVGWIWNFGEFQPTAGSQLYRFFFLSYSILMFKSFRAGYYHSLCNQKTDLEDRYKIDRTTIIDLYSDVLGLMGTKQNQPPQQAQVGESDPFYDMKPGECFRRLRVDSKVGQLRGKSSSLKKTKSNNPEMQVEGQSLPMIRLTQHRSMVQPFSHNEANQTQDSRLDRK